MGRTVARVAVQNVAYHFDELYSYVVPEGRDVSVGCRVMVPFGKGDSARQAVVIEIAESDEENLKETGVVLDKAPLFDDKMIRLALFMKERTFCTVYDALRTMLPGLSRKPNDATVKMVRLTGEELPKYTDKQQSVIDCLKGTTGEISVKEIIYATGVSTAVVDNLKKRRVLEYYEKEVFRRPYEETATETKKIPLSKSQKNAFENLLTQFENGGGTSLLYGVTGSGKTQVYLRLIDEVEKTGRGIIVMVPEISLTPQTLGLFHKRYGDKVAVFHSALSDGERLDEWKRVKRGLAKIVVGTRSAVFAPFENLGLIIMDEEQEHTYKSEQSPRYHARDIAKYRCAEDKALLVLASATPSFETFAAAKKGKYTMSVLKDRFGDAQLPVVETVDMCKERFDGNRSEISRQLLASLLENFENGHQSIVLINRRGYNTYAACNSCGEVLMCPNCSISLTYHRHSNRLMCHYCGYSIPFTTECPACGEHEVRYTGAGTQRFEEELQNLIPDARILRMDADTTMQKYSYDEKLAAFRNHEYDILVGTQMVAKGLDFENVTLVGVLSADQQLYNDDYRSMETTFDLLTQVIGRAGRGKYPGKAIIQTIKPQNEVIQLAATQDFEDFYNTEIVIRKACKFPPYCNLCTISFQGEKEERVMKSGIRFLEMIKAKSEEKEYKGMPVICLGPMPERVVKVANKYRYRLIIKCRNSKQFRRFLSELIIDFSRDKANSGVNAIPDII
ncbi:MAG: primosomal protein N' [Clostridia bacterium]|nr:primosomal protein N' [Clostridia bacterium]